MLDSPWLSLLGMVVVMAAIIGLAYVCTRCIAAGSWAGAAGLPRRKEGLSVLTQAPLGKDQRLAVVQAGKRYFLVGATPQNITLLAELEEAEAAAWLEAPDKAAGPQPSVSFGQIWKDALQRGKKR